MYSTKSGLILGFHGTDKSVVKKVINGASPLMYEESEYDWLGHGNYFWEHSPNRAMEYATLLKKHPERANFKIKTPDVIGAVIDLGRCLDLTDYGNLQLLKDGYKTVEETFRGQVMPVNKSVGGSKDLLLRKLDCLVIEALHDLVGQDEFDSVRGVFWEGDELYPTAGFKEKNHIQICIRNPNCIKGYFLPRNLESKARRV